MIGFPRRREEIGCSRKECKPTILRRDTGRAHIHEIAIPDRIVLKRKV